MRRPRDKQADAILIEFQVFDKKTESTLEETVQRPKQIEEKNTVQDLLSRGFTKEQIRKYGFAFDEKTVQIGC